ncbi:MAG: 4-(cytidine 5'-diphospho)-2-C-methyl-D-erythritol kinase [Dehalococcoidia bacterium]|nr:4-(cytidine 5'-diphospho)-2-C-methyl-D-erythritol kinase [Dehalococcoidia bacterium]
MIEVFSPAKINFVLEILNKRSDGFHGISSVMAPISLDDKIKISQSNINTIKFISKYNNDFDNATRVIHKIINEMKTIARTSFPIDIVVNKNILSPSGLGGVSSNIASIIFSINQLWNIGLSQQQLRDFSMNFGSDISFFFSKEAALVTGRGELLESLPVKILCPVIVMPMANITPQSNKTKTMYSKIIQKDMTDGARTQTFIRNISNTNSLNNYCFNVFESVIERHYPEQFYLMKKIEHIIGIQVHLSGSGPAIYTIPDQSHTTENIRKKLMDNSIESFVVSCLQES